MRPFISAPALPLALSTALGLLIVLSLQADDGREMELKGTITCAKCDLKEASKCHTVIWIEGDHGLHFSYYFDEVADKKYHEKICRGPHKGTVRGNVTDRDGKKWIKVDKLQWKAGKGD
jgi:hypothetical protein